jgi:Fic family protein
VLQNQLFPEKEQRESDKEVLRYKEAVLWGRKALEKHPLSTRLILGIQATLIPFTAPGYRKLQNAIVNRASGKRIFTPPAAARIPGLIRNWEKFVSNDKDGIDPLIKAAVAHYQFEAIHPFDDGNGRTGRILMILQLMQSDILKLPVLYISGYINRNRERYYNLLNAVTENKEWAEFILFMLNGFYLQAVETKNVLLDILETHDAFKEKMRKELRKIYSTDLADALFSYPIITQAKLAKELGVHYITADKYLSNLAEAGMLGEKKSGKYHLYFNTELIKILQRE